MRHILTRLHFWICAALVPSGETSQEPAPPVEVSFLGASSSSVQQTCPRNNQHKRSRISEAKPHRIASSLKRLEFYGVSNSTTSRQDSARPTTAGPKSTSSRHSITACPYPRPAPPTSGSVDWRISGEMDGSLTKHCPQMILRAISLWHPWHARQRFHLSIQVG